MASTFSSLLRIELIGTGDQSGTWGNTTNTNLGTLIEQAIAGTTTIDVTAGNVTLTNFNGATDQARCAAIKVIGTPGTSRNIIAPALSHIYVVANASDSAVVLKTSISSGLTIPAGDIVLAYYDATVGVADFKLVGKPSASTNTANTLVLRDASGNFAAGTITATFVGSISGGTGTFTNLSSTGNTFIGDTAGDTLTVAATPAFLVAIPVASGGTGVTTSTGSGSNVLNTSPTLVTPILGTPTSGTLTNCTGLPIDGGTTGTLPVARGGTGVTTSTGSGNNVLSTSPTLVTPILGTPTSGTLTNCTGLPIDGGTTGTLPVARGGTGVTSSTGSGNVVLSASPALTGTPTAPTAAVGTNTTQLATTAFVQSAIPSGVIVMWSGSIATIPSGWLLCNGTSGTPDLRDRFVVGAGSAYGVAATGGSANATLVAHSHTATSFVNDPGHAHGLNIAPNIIRNGGDERDGAGNAGSATNAATTGITVSTSISTEGSSATNANLPPYYALAYIMKA